MRLLLYICIGIGLVLCGGSCGSSREGREMSLSAGEYYDLGRYARLDEDWEGAIGYFEKALSAAEVAGSDYYRGYACQQLSALWAMAYEYGAALDYARLSAAALEACGETAGALLSRLAMASHHLSLGDPAAAQALLPPLRAAFSSPDSPAAPRLSHLEAAVLSRPASGPSPDRGGADAGVGSGSLGRAGCSVDRGGADACVSSSAGVGSGSVGRGDCTASTHSAIAASGAVTTSPATGHTACTPHAASPAACGHAARGTSCSAFAAGNASLARGGASSPESSDCSVGRAGCSVGHAGCSVDRGGADACVGSSACVGAGAVTTSLATGNASLARGGAGSTHSSVAASPAACGHAARGTSCTNASAGVACTGALDQLASGASVSAGAHNLAATADGAAPRKNPIEKKH